MRTHGEHAARDASILDGIEGPRQLRALPEAALPDLATALREFLIRETARIGGHFAASLGTVELTVALHYVFDTPRDAIVWDVGHQTYGHKVLTGRRGAFGTLRRYGGLSGFLRRDESPFDAFGAGHSSTSISAALGMAIAAERRGETAKSVAVIGDGSLTAGLAFEALNHAGATRADLLVILNDNGMSISPNVGALGTAGKAADAPPTRGFFESLGFDYYGPDDGHDLPALLARLKALRPLRGPRVLHLRTRKGRGYALAEDDPVRYHGVAPFDPAVGLQPSGGPKVPAYTDVFADWLCDMAERDPRLVAVTPAMREGSGLTGFAARFPDRYFDVGIAEQHCVTFAAGLACRGLKPVVAIYSTFLQRGFDQLVHDVALQRLPVLFAIDRGGLVGPDGATHNGTLDLTYLRCVPGMTVMTPSDGPELRRMLSTAWQQDGPVAVRYPRVSATAAVSRSFDTLPLGRADVTRIGGGVAFLVFGTLLGTAVDVAETLDATVINMRCVKPLDARAVREAARRHGLLVTLEEGTVAGGAGSAVNDCLARQGIAVPVLNLGLPDRPIEHGSREEVLHEAGLDRAGILVAVARRMVDLRQSAPAWRHAAAAMAALEAAPGTP
ncbi:MAG: 1-deoxy-D-xylulose-5-phosphate synthase [Steroidobacteraceae bacterium]|jgi:1-deoxy-D-xylulose-5-phosphate synthase|nr:1-deoxy-D-xylulose-5-phosphate synthase [Steroidobacteraceae bacterium]